MAPAPANVRRHFLPWDRPLLPQAVEFLAEGWAGDGPLDLSRLLVVVPTKQSGRRLREALADHALVRDQAVFAPRVLTPEGLIPADSSVRTASRLDSLLAWIVLLQAGDFAAFREVFPIDPPSRGFSWALRVADELLRVQGVLAEGGLRFGDVAGKAGEDCPELERWRQLGKLEELYDGLLRDRGLRDMQAAKISAARAPVGFSDIDRIVMVGTPDPLPLAIVTLSAHARSLPMHVLVFAPDSEAGSFDEWGRPFPSAWGNRPPALPEFQDRVRLCADPADQAAEIAALARSYGNPEGVLGIGVADAGLVPILESALRREGFDVYNPEGVSRRHEELYHLLSALAKIGVEPNFDAVAALGRCPAFLKFLKGRLGAGFSTEQWLRGIDELRLRHLPADLTEARDRAAKMGEFSELAPALETMDEVRAKLAAGEFAAGASSALETVYAAISLNLAGEREARFAEAAGEWTKIVRDCAEAAGHLGLAESWELALRLFGERAGAGEKPEGAIELNGWLELLWEDAGHLAVAGMNDGSVPQAITGDPFLPESLREKLGLTINATRFARDAYILQALAACRAARGKLDLLLGKTSAVGDPLKPSRLLLRCADAEMPERVQRLFRPIGLHRPHLAWTRTWRLSPPQAPAPSRVAVTALRDWLSCPFRFYLKHVLRMAPFDAAKSELDDLDFGTLCHGVLESMGRDPALRDCIDPKKLEDFMSAELDRRIRANFGESLTMPLIIQREAARQRLGKAAESQAREREAGWQIAEVEKKVSMQIGGLLVSGKIDRVDRHLKSGEVRVLDYKTSDAARIPLEAHLRAARSDDDVAVWARCEVHGENRIWTDLQLPFYRHVLADEFPGGVACGYFNLPKAIGETGLAIWDDYPRALHEAALRCVEGVCGAISLAEFWPPNERLGLDRDDFASLFHHGVAASVDWEGGKR